MQKFICNACIIFLVICRYAWAVKTLSPLMHPFSAALEQDKALSGLGSHSETTRGWRQKCTVQSEQKLWLSSQLCHLPVEWPQASYLMCLNQLSLLQNKENRVHYDELVFRIWNDNLCKICVHISPRSNGSVFYELTAGRGFIEHTSEKEESTALNVFSRGYRDIQMCTYKVVP